MSKDKTVKRGGKATTLVSLLALGLVAGNYYGDIRRDQRLQNSETTLEVVRSAFISPATLQKTEKSVYLALLQGRPFGTAFVVDRERGLLATNSHIATWAEKFGPLSVIGMDGEALEVTGVRMHDGYKAFPQHVSVYEPTKTTPGVAGGRAIKVPALFDMVDGYDVALLQVSREDAAKLAPDLPLASREELYALRTGDGIASVGYPLDLSSTAVIEMQSLTPKATVGRISALSSFVGVRSDNGTNDTISQLIIHPLHTQPGTSGSPMINDKGHVIAINSGASARAARDGSIIEAGDRHGQRADMVLDLLEDMDNEAVSDLYRPIWDKQLAQFDRMPDVFAEVMTAIMAPKRDLAKATKTVRDLTFTPGLADPVYQASQTAHSLRTTIELDPAKMHLVFATDYRSSVGGCNPKFRIAKTDGSFLSAEGIGTNEFTIFQAQISAGSLPVGPMSIEFLEPAGCNSSGQTMHLHVYSWEAGDIAVAQNRQGPMGVMSALWQQVATAAKLVAKYIAG